MSAAFLGAVCCLLTVVLDLPALRVGGLALLGFAAALGAAGLVRAPWLRVLVAIGAVGLVAAVLAVAYDVAGAHVVDGLAGVAAILAVGLAWVQAPPIQPQHSSQRGPQHSSQRRKVGGNHRA